MRRTLLMTSMALMFAAAMALSGVAQAKPTADAQCAKVAIKTLGASFDLSGYTFVGGTAGNDDFTGKATEGPDVFCGFGGNDSMFELDEGDNFLGGAGNDQVTYNDGTFNGGAGDDSVSINYGTSNGGFNGGAGNDSVGTNYRFFNGGAGNDSVSSNYYTFNGGEGNDIVDKNELSGNFYGSEGDDRVGVNAGFFDGGAGNDGVTGTNYGTFNGGAGEDFVTINGAFGVFNQD